MRKAIPLAVTQADPYPLKGEGGRIMPLGGVGGGALAMLHRIHTLSSNDFGSESPNGLNQKEMYGNIYAWLPKAMSTLEPTSILTSHISLPLHADWSHPTGC